MLLTISIDIDGKHRVLREIELTPEDIMKDPEKLRRLAFNMMAGFIHETLGFTQNEQDISTQVHHGS